MHGLGKFTGETNVWHAGFAPHQISVRSVGNATADGLLQTILDAIEAFLGALAGQEGLVVGIVIAGDQVGSLRIGTRQNNGGHAHHISRKTSCDQLLAGFLRRHQHLATHVTALLHSSQLVFKVNTGSPCGNHVLHQLEGIEHTAKTGFSIRHDGQEVVDELRITRIDATTPLDFVGALEGVVDAAHHGRHRVIGVQRLVGVHGLGGVAISSDLPTRQVHRFQTRFGLLHGLTGGDGPESIHITLLGVAIDLRPQLFSPSLSQCVLRLQTAAQTNHISSAIAALDALPTGVLRPVLFEGGDLLFTAQLLVQRLGHGALLSG